MPPPSSHTTVHTVPYTAVPAVMIGYYLLACCHINAQSYLVDSVHYFQLRPSFEVSVQNNQKFGSNAATGSGLQHTAAVL